MPARTPIGSEVFGLGRGYGFGGREGGKEGRERWGSGNEEEEEENGWREKEFGGGAGKEDGEEGGERGEREVSESFFFFSFERNGFVERCGLVWDVEGWRVGGVGEQRGLVV